MKTRPITLRSGAAALLLAMGALSAETPPPVYQAPAPAPAPASSPTPPPSAPPKQSETELEKLVAPIALYPDPLIATILPASVYPLEIVQAARFVKETNNLAQLDAQPWDENVKAVARVPAVIQKMNEDLQWTIALGEAFLAQEQEVMAAIQTLRAKAQQTGTLQTTSQQVVVVTNTVVEKTVEQQTVVVTNTIVQIQPANPQVIYVPQYNPAVVYAPPPAYVYDPVAPLVTFGVGVAVGAVIANNCDWHGGGVYVGHHGVAVWGGGGYHGDVDVDVNRNVNVNRNTTVNQQKWQPDQSRLSASGASGTSASANTRQARGWGTGAAPSSTANVAARSAPATASARAPAAGTPAPRPSASAPSSRPPGSPNVSQPRTSATAARPASRESAFSGMSSGASARNYSSRGASSRSGGFGGGGRGGGRR